MGAKERYGIEVTLDGRVGASETPAFVERDAPVEAEDVCTGGGHGGEERRGVDAEVDDGDAKGLDALDEFAGLGQDVVDVVVDGERAGPAVEDLDDVCAGCDLLRGVVDKDR